MSEDLLHTLRINGIVCRGADHARTGYASFALILPEHLQKAVKIVDEEGYFLEDITCCQVKEGLELIYHFDNFHYPGRLCLRALIREDEAEIPSIACIYPGAEWHERECTDFFGITFRGNPNPVPLLLSPRNPGPVLKKTQDGLKGLQELLPAGPAENIPERASGIEAVLNRCVERIGKNGGEK